MYRSAIITHIGTGVVMDALLPSEGHFLTAASIQPRETAPGALDTVPCEFFAAIDLLRADSPTTPPLIQLAYGPIGGICNLAWSGRIFLDTALSIRFRVLSRRVYTFNCSILTGD